MNSGRPMVILLAVLACGWARADPPPGYYDAAIGKAGPELRAALHAIISPHHVIPYANVGVTNTATALMVLDEDPLNTNNVLLLYARRSEAKTNFGTTTGWNREHQWPNSYGLDSHLPAYSDLFNLRAEDATVNSARNNKLYDQSNTNDTAYRRPAFPEATLTSTDSDSWEPPDEVKGDIARALFYMAIRYNGLPTNEPALFLTDALPQISGTTNLMGRLSTLLRWHRADPVDDRERLRNDRVFLYYQHNRNPFVDHPEWVLLAFHPPLLITRDGTALKLRWPPAFVSALVESRSFSPTGGEGRDEGAFGGFWQPVAGTPTLTNGFWEISEPVSGNLTFFRLRLP